jgi:hypothetical protein
VLGADAPGLLADRAQRREQLVACALLGELDLDGGVELDDRQLGGLVEPACKSAAGRTGTS